MKQVWVLRRRRSECLLCGNVVILLLFFMFLYMDGGVWCLGSMSSIAISYGEKGSVYCGLRSDGSHFVECFGSNPGIVRATPKRSRFLGLTGGSGFVCGLLLGSNQPFCWGNNAFIHTGVPLRMGLKTQYLEISAGDDHICGLRKPLLGRLTNISLVDCWGYNMTKSYTFEGQIQSISAGSVFSCGLFAQNRSVFCWGDEASSDVIALIPKESKFKKIAAGGYHVCGILEGVSSRVVCWGRSLDVEEDISSKSHPFGWQMNVEIAPEEPMLSVVGGKFHACGIRTSDRNVVCWGYRVERSTSPPSDAQVFEIAAGDYFTCGVLAQQSLLPVCWGIAFPSSLPIAAPLEACVTNPCLPDFYAFNNASAPCSYPGAHYCLRCSIGCPSEMYEVARCNASSDRQCAYDCSNCSSTECRSACSSSSESSSNKFWSLQAPIIVAEVSFAVLFVTAVSFTAVRYVRYKLSNCRCNVKAKKSSGNGSFSKKMVKPLPELEELKIRRAQKFTYEELEGATDGFKEESIVGKGSFSCVFKGVLRDGTVVAVKRANDSLGLKKNLKEFHNELDLLSRLNHAHLLNLLGYFMAMLALP